jgi:hypothetical protein
MRAALVSLASWRKRGFGPKRAVILHGGQVHLPTRRPTGLTRVPAATTLKLKLANGVLRILASPLPATEEWARRLGCRVLTRSASGEYGVVIPLRNTRGNPVIHRLSHWAGSEIQDFHDTVHSLRATLRDPAEQFTSDRRRSGTASPIAWW